ncbi:unnamed protein product [Dicrocoelium dendriticum]|nr:unnamed protein product [Dicrocoelium dendriticum]
MLLFIILASLLTTIAIVLNGEACRYLHKPSAIRVTDAALDMYLLHKLDNWIIGAGLPPNIRELIAPTPPKNTLSTLLLTCRPSLGAVTSNISLLHSLGIENIVNITSFIKNKKLQDIIDINYPTVVDQILGMDLGSHVPNDMKDLLQRAQNVALILESPNYTDAVNSLRKSPVDLEATNTFLDNLELDVKRTTSMTSGRANPRFRFAELTINEVRTQLKHLGPLIQNANLLAQTVEKLQQQNSLSDHLRKLGVTLDNTLKRSYLITASAGDEKHCFVTLSDPKVLEAPILPAYKNATQSLLADLSNGLDNLTTEFTGAVVSCNRLHYVVNSMIQVSCSTTGLINWLGATLTFQSFIILYGHIYSV